MQCRLLLPRECLFCDAERWRNWQHLSEWKLLSCGERQPNLVPSRIFSELYRCLEHRRMLAMHTRSILCDTWANSPNGKLYSGLLLSCWLIAKRTFRLLVPNRFHLSSRVSEHDLMPSWPIHSSPWVLLVCGLPGRPVLLKQPVRHPLRPRQLLSRRQSAHPMSRWHLQLHLQQH